MIATPRTVTMNKDVKYKKAVAKPARDRQTSVTRGSRPVVSRDPRKLSTQSSFMSSTSVSGQRRLSREEIINEMEKEQDAIVVRLLREIEGLKEENSRLKNQLHHPVPTRKSSPFLESESAIFDEEECNYSYTLDTSMRKFSDGASKRTVLPLTPKDSVTHIAHRPRRLSRNASMSNGTSISDTVFPIETKINSAPITSRNFSPADLPHHTLLPRSLSGGFSSNDLTETGALLHDRRRRSSNYSLDGSNSLKADLMAKRFQTGSLK
ncbi:rts3p [Saccharomyces arboricola H-6]|uniref:Rts3p n=1 Tax=Saccharomyces arboricola (strain H-6 / AS 2.3317 / CBS 10644) TaxID=1160507 RepID=J8Q7G7_SACAR|nr:rts3p [Saccharomyces arboricola H-6]